MTRFTPTSAPPGRLLRLSIVLDTRNAPSRLREVARMCERAGIDSLWVHDHFVAPDGEPRLEAWTALAIAGLETSRVRVGAKLTASFRPPATLAAMAGTLDAAVGGRLELALSSGRQEGEHRAFGVGFPDTRERTERLVAYAALVRGLLAGEIVDAAEPFPLRGAELGVASAQEGGPPISIEATTLVEVRAAIAVADDVLIPAASIRESGFALDGVRRACEEAGRPPETLGIALEIPVSIGRTSAEAQARADAEPMFSLIGHPDRVGIFGTLEQCQEHVIRLAHDGVTDLRCVLANTPDVHDAIAQLTAMVVGTIDVLAPGVPRSPDPEPPQGWGGRSNAR